MRSVSKRELNQQTAHVLATVDSGETVVVTERGIPRWRIEAIGALVDPVERLRLAGRITEPKKEPAPWPAALDDPAGREYSPAEIDALYVESRGDH
jgi:antitoxin (DNA-binding transcriptional repressor) of toxin-antitoxin stability system